jgi:hypothetical protein
MSSEERIVWTAKINLIISLVPVSSLLILAALYHRSSDGSSLKDLARLLT